MVETSNSSPKYPKLFITPSFSKQETTGRYRNRINKTEDDGIELENTDANYK